MNLGEALKICNTLQAMLTRSSDMGICYKLELSGTSDCVRQEFLLTARQWPKYSGHALFPVPHPKRRPVDAFINCPKWEGEYGDNRRELVMFLLDNIERRIRKTKKLPAYQERLQIIKALNKVIRKEVTPISGLCFYVESHVSFDASHLFDANKMALFIKWPHCYDVARPLMPIGGESEYYNTLRKYEGESGRKRRSLAAFIVKHYEAEQLAMELIV